MERLQTARENEIIIYTNRWTMMPMLVMSILCAIGMLAFTIFAGIAMLVYPDQRNGGTVGAIIFFLVFTVLCLWLVRSMLDLAKPRTPMLVINHEGIRAGTRTYGSTEFFFPWQEIQALYVLGAMFCIRPADKERLLSGFGPIKRFMLRATFPKDIYVTQFYLARPVSGVFQQLQENFAYELESYHIQIQP